ncbi:hypothetical protein ABIE00_002900 [Arthrobacter sp. OAP107]
MDWTKNYEQLMLLDGRQPYGCSFRQCSHIALNTFGMLLHHGFGVHTCTTEHLPERRQSLSAVPAKPRKNPCAQAADGSVVSGPRQAGPSLLDSAKR